MPGAARERIATPPAGTALSLPAPMCLRRRSFDERDVAILVQVVTKFQVIPLCLTTGLI